MLKLHHTKDDVQNARQQIKKVTSHTHKHKPENNQGKEKKQSFDTDPVCVQIILIKH